MTYVKICGCRSAEEALAAAAAGADFIGLVFAESRRRVSVEEASEVVRALGTPLLQMEPAADSPPSLYRGESGGVRAWFEHGASALERLLARKRPLTVGVFAGAGPDEVDETAEECGLDLVQLSGDETWETCLRVGRQAIKVVHVRPQDTAADVVERIESGSALAVLLDRAEGSAYGGTGKALAWSVAGEVAVALPVWLAGGLTPANVGEAIARVRPWCVDVSSGVETDGVKDLAKVRAFVGAAKAGSAD